MRSVDRDRPGAPPLLRWIVFIALPASVWPILAWVHAERVPASALTLREARSSEHELRTLPDDWRTTGVGVEERTYWLEFRAERTEPAEWAVYLPSLSMNAAVYLNGHFLGDGGDFAEPMARNWYRPLLLPFSSALLTRGVNSLRIRVQADLPGTGLLGLVHVGPHRALARAYARHHRLKVTAVWIITLCLVMVGLFMTALWLGWRDEPSYGWLAASAFAWVGMHLNGLIVDIPVATQTWYGLWYSAVGWWATTQVRFLLAFMGEEIPLLERGVVILGFAGTAVAALLAATRSPWLHPFARIWLTAGLLAGGYTASRVLRVLRDRGHEIKVAFPYVLGISVIVCALHDWLMIVGLTRGAYDAYLPYSAPLLLVGMGWALLDRFVGALRQSESLAAELEHRVEHKREELDESYERLREVERSRVLAEERERILRDMHDGLGSHLVSTLSLIEGAPSPREAVGGAIRTALDELRLMVDSLEPDEGDLVAALAMLRARMQSRLEAAGIDVVWRVDDLPTIADFGPGKILQVLRIVQEAVTNVVKHADARTITVSTAVDDGGQPNRRVRVEIVDDGRGIGEENRPGRGLQHMRERAAEIGVELEIHGSPRGTSVRLLIPLGEAAAA